MALILVVDDSQDDLEIVRDFLVTHSHSYRFASSGEEALKRLGDEKFDLIISDYHMKEGDGLWLLQELKKIAEAPHCIMVTGEFRYSPEFYFEKGAAALCFKPIIWAHLKAEIDRLL